VRQGSRAALLIASALAVCTVSGCTNNNRSTDTGPPAAPSVAAQVWSRWQGFVDWPALPVAAPSKQTWSLDFTSLFQSGSYSVPDTPDPGGRVAGVTPTGELAGYDHTGTRVWGTPLPALKGTAQPDEKPLVSELQASGLNLLVVNRKITSTADPAGDDQIDVFDGASGQFLWTRTGNRVRAPILLDSRRALLDLTNSRTGDGLDEIDVRTGKVLWHNPNVAVCRAYFGHILCGTSDTKGIALVDPDTGATRWTAPHPLTLKAAALSTEAIVDNTVYLTDGETTQLTAVDLTTGQVRWQHNTDINMISDVLPLDATHVIAAGLVNGASGITGATERLVSMNVDTGEEFALLYDSKVDTGSPTPDTSVDLIRVNGTQYYLVEEPDGSLSTRDVKGNQVAAIAKACAGGRHSLAGDTAACTDGNGTLVLYSIPHLARRSSLALDQRGVASLHVVANACMIEAGEKLIGLN
jgi:outer membrane protein assembly factor BamB